MCSRFPDGQTGAALWRRLGYLIGGRITADGEMRRHSCGGDLIALHQCGIHAEWRRGAFPWIRERACAVSRSGCVPGIRLAAASSGHSSGHPRQHDAVAVGMAAGAFSVLIFPAWFVRCPSGIGVSPPRCTMQAARQSRCKAEKAGRCTAKQSKARVRGKNAKESSLTRYVYEVWGYGVRGTGAAPPTGDGLPHDRPYTPRY